MRLRPLYCALCATALSALVVSTLIAQARGQGSGSALAPPAVYPHDMSAYGCTHFDEKVCDAATAPAPMFDPLVGQWVRFTLIRNGFSVQPPDAPLYLQFGPDGYWSMMEFPANRPKISKPLEQQTPQELYARFDASDGGWGTYTQDGMVNDRHHYADIAAPGNGGAEHVRAWRFEGNVLVLEGTGTNHSPEIKTRKLPIQTLASKNIVGAYERTALAVDGASVQQIVPQHLLLGEDGWFQETLLPTGRPRPQGKPMDQWTPQEFAAAYKGVEAARGTYNADGTTIIRKHIGDLDPNLEGKDATGTYTLQGGTLTITGTDAAGRKVTETFTKMKPYNVYAPYTPPARAGGAGRAGGAQ
jgi:hypothetical protein